MPMTSSLRTLPSCLPCRIRTCLIGVLVLMASCWSGAKANAAFISSAEIQLGIYGGPLVNDQIANSTSLAPITLEDEVQSGRYFASAFASVEPFPAGPTTRISFRAEAIARQSSRAEFPDTLTVGVQAIATATWQDHIYASWLPNEPRAEFIWGVVLHLNGSLSVQFAHYSYQAIAGVNLSTAIGGAVGYLPFQQSVPGSQAFDDRTTTVRTPSEAIFNPLGVDFYASLVASASYSSFVGGTRSVVDSSFGHTAQFLGFVALDANGNIIPGMNSKIQIQSDSGGQYRFLDTLEEPAVNAVPEPPGFVLFGMAIFAILACQSRRLLKSKCESLVGS